MKEFNGKSNEMFSNLINASIEEIEQRYNKKMEEINTPAKLAEYCTRRHIKYKKPEISLPKRYRKEADKEIKEVREKIANIAKAHDFSSEFIITIEWTRSRMWGSNPKAYTNYGFESNSIGGCGYDKKSTATAEALNSNLSILKLMYEKKNANIDKHNHELLGYGSGYGILPYFEGGVGVDSHKRIISDLGLKMETVTSTDHTDVFIVRRGCDTNESQ